MSIAAPPPVRSTQPRRTAVGGGRAAHISEYAELSRRIKAAGLLERRLLPYVLRTALLVAAIAIGAIALVVLGHSWWQIGVAAWFGAVFAQAGFLAHDGAHRQVFASNARNEWFSRIVANLVVGLSYGWWMQKHARHHGNPNTIGKDTDLDANAIVFVPEDADARTGLLARIMRRQGWFFLPAMTLTGVDLHVKSIRNLLASRDRSHRVVEMTLLVVRLVGFAALLLVLAGPVVGAAALIVQILVFGLLLGGAFAPNHIGMPLIERGRRVDYLRRQVLTSRNISGGPLVDLLMGGLNHQIEHHLFPSMPSAHLRAARALIRAHCADVGVPYLERTLPQALRDVTRYIHRVGLRNADPFDCPAAAVLRLA